MTNATHKAKTDAGNPLCADIVDKTSRCEQMIVRQCLFSLLGGLAAFSGAMCHAADVVADNGTSATVFVEEGNVLEQADGVYLPNDTGMMLKSGHGTWRVPIEKFFFGLPGNTTVGAGALELTSGGSEPSVPDVSEILGKAAFWVDASKADSIQKSGDEVSVWHDARDADGTLHPRAVYDADVSKTHPISSACNGKAAVYFGGYGAASKTTNGNGASMKWCKPDGETRNELPNIHHAFIVNSVADSYGIVLGHASNAHFIVGDVNRKLSTHYWAKSSSDSRQVCSGRTYLDGAMVDPYLDGVSTGRHLLEVDMLGIPGAADNFFNDRNYSQTTSAGGDRTGGDYLHEVLVFTNALSEAERVLVAAYLMKKWDIPSFKDGGCIELEPESEFASGVDLLDSAGIAVSGRGAYVVGSDAVPVSNMSNIAHSVAMKMQKDTPVNMRLARAVAIEAGDSVESARSYRGDTITRSDGDDDGTVTKTGDGVLYVSSIPDSVSNFVVRSGEVRFLPANAEVESGQGLEAIIPNAGFEEGPWDSDKVGFLNEEEARGWTAWSLNQDYRNEAFFYNVTSGVTQVEYNGSLYTNDIPQGCCVLALKRDASAMTTVTLPGDGIYELTFWTSGRSFSGGSMHFLKLCFGQGENLPAIGTVTSSYGPWKKHSYRLPWSKAGSYQLAFVSYDIGADKLMLIDDIHLRFVSSARKSMSGVVPNGGFENLVVPLGDATHFRASNEVVGWTFSQPEQIGANAEAYVGLATPYMTQQLSFSYFDQAGSSWGESGIAFFRTGGVAQSEAFAVSEGRWRLEADVSNFVINNNATKSGSLNAVAVVGGGETDLGTVVVNNRKCKRAVWPVVLTNASVAQVSLKLSLTNAACVTVDNVDLNRVAGSGNLIANGGFEDSTTGWTVAVNKKGKNLVATTYASAPKRYGAEACEGKNFMRIVNDGSVSQAVDIPDAGLYRLSFCSHMRFDSQDGIESRGYNPLRAWIVSGGSVTNVIGYTEPADNLKLSCCSNFVESAFTFTVPEPGTYEIGIQGVVDDDVVGHVNSNKDGSETCLDSVSLVRIDDVDLEPTVGFATNAVLAVEAGARVRFDFQGTNTLSGVVLGGKSRTGVISAETYPAYVSGPGALYVKERRGLAIILR